MSSEPLLAYSPLPLPEKAPDSPPRRLASIDAYRGLVMFLMMAEVLQLCAVAAAVPGAATGLGVPLPSPVARRVGRLLAPRPDPAVVLVPGRRRACRSRSPAGWPGGSRRARMTAHAVWRALVLVFLGVFLRSIGRDADELHLRGHAHADRPGLRFLFLLGFGPARDQWIALVVILVGYWAAFAVYPAAGPGLRLRRGAACPADWPHLAERASRAHWNKNSNLAWAFDTWFLNLFPREQPFTYNGGGYATLSFIPTLATMILGLLAGGVLRRERPAVVEARPGWSSRGVVGLAAGLGRSASWGSARSSSGSGRRAGSSSAAGWCFLFLAGFYAVIDVLGLRRLGVPAARDRHELDRRLLSWPT